MNYQIGALGAEAQTADFACGEPVLDQYLQRYARQDIKRGVARVFVATAEPQPAEVLGFYTLSAASIAADTLPENWRKRLPRYPVPVAAGDRVRLGSALFIVRKLSGDCITAVGLSLEESAQAPV